MTATPVVLSYYAYKPSTAAAILFAVLYSLTFLGTTFQVIRYRSWVWTVMCLASLMEAVGYIFRIYSTQHVEGRTTYIVQFCLIILAPVLMAAAYYTIFGRIVYHIVPAESRTFKLLWIPPRFVTPIFVTCDMLAFLIQLIGAATVASTQVTSPNAKEKLNRGRSIALVGLGVQIACFGLFSLIAVRFNFTSARFEQDFLIRTGSEHGEKFYQMEGQKRQLKKNWETLLRVINTTCLLILIRSVYRVVDFALGKTGYTEANEWVFYVFDALPMLPCVALYLYWHPALYLPYLGFRVPKQAKM